MTKVKGILAAAIIHGAVTRVIETRSMPTLIEQRNDLLTELETLTGKVKAETRAFSEEEVAKFEDIKKQIEALDKTLEALKVAANIEQMEEEKAPGNEERSIEAMETRAFEGFIRNAVENRADTNLTKTQNGALIPKTIAKKIIELVKEISPIYQLASQYNVKGDLIIPYYNEEDGTITAAYATEFQELESSSAKFSGIELKGFLVGALSKISQSLANNTDFDVVAFVVKKIAESIAEFIENELINGRTDKIEGLKGITASQTITAASTTVITIDELIDLQEAVPDAFQDKAFWIMNKATRKAIRKMKDEEGNLILNRDATAKWGYTLFGKDVYISKSVEAPAAGKNAIYYGDFSGLAVKLSEEVSVKVLHEKYATQHAIGVVSFVELDSKIEHAQKIAKLKMKAA